MSPNLIAILPEIVLTLTAVLVMLADASLAPGKPRRLLGWVAILGAFAAGSFSLWQLRLVDASGPITAYSGTVQVDAFSVFFHLLIAAIVMVTLLGSLDYFAPPAAMAEHSETARLAYTHVGEYFALVLFGATGMMFMTCSVELLMVFIGLEISSISTYILAGFRKGQGVSAEAALKYFLLGSFATSFFLYGIALAFGATGSTSIAAIAAGMSTTHTPVLALLSVAMILIGIGFKVSAAPFHVWTPDVYQGAPAPVVGLMSTAPKAAAFAVLLRVLFNAVPTLRATWLPLILALSVASMFIGNLGALMQRDVKRLLAYSSIAHAGYLLAAFTSTHPEAVASACFYTAAYAAMNVGAFLVITELSGVDETMRTIDDFTGAAKSRPYLSGLLAFFLCSLIGIPFTAGFFGKFYVFSAAVHGGFTWLAVLGLLNSGIACFYYLRLMTALYSRPLHGEVRGAMARVTPSAALGLAFAGLATLALGIFPGPVLSLVQRAAPKTIPIISSAPSSSATASLTNGQ
ncbi:NADH dehydrogenase subunit N [Bryocella elongata]|uniref:NADH-quinone oxidoreductase subunit N n=1 Tax=Bryocella elongata TaxID=863522 RepID=A0A1H5T7T8_9BACT|nr:NADH-quinone oxidoreductase subunit N [Bryocella elongata]SEF58856.1 NADH dehydrogenase subunit N [Bryocella elongata]